MQLTAALYLAWRPSTRFAPRPGLHLDRPPFSPDNCTMQARARHIAAVVALLGFALAALSPAAADELEFRAKPAEAYAARDSHEGVVVAVEPFDTPELTKPAFGKIDFRKAGIVPVLVVIANNTYRTIRLDEASVRFISGDRQQIEPTPAEDVVRRFGGGYSRDSGPFPIPRRSSRPLKSRDATEVIAREFVVRMIPPQTSVSGFFYFDLRRARTQLPGGTFFLTDLFWADDSQALMFFEVSFDDALKARR